jgi:phosphopantothenoylcysteine decarboxylase/phosphopantothenate--cysteine ligase
MRDAVTAALADCAALIMAAAVADYSPMETAPQKIKKGAETWTLEMARTPDILSEATGDFVKVGFAAETENATANARDKLTRKGLDLIAVNDVTDPQGGFSSDTNRVTLIGKDGTSENLPLMSKYDVAHRILDRVVGLLTSAR